MPTFEEWFASTDKVDWRLFGKKDLYEAYSAGRADEKFEANVKSGDSANEAEKDARRKVAIEKIGDRIRTGELENLNADVDAIIKIAQG